MICTHCREAGHWLVRAVATQSSEGFRPIYRALAASAHGRCKGGTWCDCAHVLAA